MTFGTALIAFAAFGSSATAMTVTSTGEGGACSLRAAIEAVNTNNSATPCGVVNGSGPTTIDLPAGTYTLTNGQLQVAAGANIEVVGANTGIPGLTVIDAGGTNRVFEVLVGGTLKLVGVQITGGRTAGGAASTGTFSAGGQGEPGGGIFNDGSLTLDHSVVTGNQTGGGGLGFNGINVVGTSRSGTSGGEGGAGGGIFNDVGASLTITDSAITDNSTGNGGRGGDGAMGVQGCCAGHFPNGTAGGNGAWAGDGGGIFNWGSATITRSTISGNGTGRGGAGGSGGLGASQLEGEPGEGSGAGTGGDGGDGGNGGRQYRKDQGTYWDFERGGGGIFNGGSMTITASTISGNTVGAGGLGGSSGPGGPNSNGTFRTSGRAGTGGGGGRGGGILSGGGGINARTPLTMTNVTIYGNRTGDGGIGGGGGGGATTTLGGGAGGWGGNGGGLWGQGARTNSAANLINVTISGNGVGAGGLAGASANPNPSGNGSPGERGVGAGVAAGGRYSAGAGINLTNTIVAGNGNAQVGDENCSNTGSPATNVNVADRGNNLTFPGTSCPGTVANPNLGLFSNNGGPTSTMVPALGSPAIGGVPLASCTVNTDQRGKPRPGPTKTACDIGAVETDPTVSPPDTTPPDTVIDSGPSGSITANQVTFAFHGEPANDTVKYQCKMDSGEFADCVSPKTYASLSNGSHTFSVRAFDAAGNYDTSPATRTFSISSTPPPKAIIGKVGVTGPAKSKKGNLVTFKVKVTNTGKTRATGVKVRATGAGSGVTRPIGDIGAGASKTVQVRIRMNRVGKKKITFKVTSANAGSKSAAKTVKVRKRRK